MEPTQTDSTTSLTPILRKAGLTESQAKGYLALIEHGALTPVELAEKTGENRTNGYMICEKLEKLGLATKKEAKKALYTPSHPSALEVLAEKRRKIVQRDEKMIKDNLGEIVEHYYRFQSTPGVEVGYGEEGVEKIRARTLAKQKELLFVRSSADSRYNQEKLADFIKNRVKLGISAQSIAPAEHSTTTSHEQLDEWLLDRTLLPPGLYSAPVEIDVFGDTVAFIDFQNGSMSTLITSATIAEAMRQLFFLAKRSGGERHDQEQMPRPVADQRADASSQP